MLGAVMRSRAWCCSSVSVADAVRDAGMATLGKQKIITKYGQYGEARQAVEQSGGCGPLVLYR